MTRTLCKYIYNMYYDQVCLIEIVPRVYHFVVQGCRTRPPEPAHGTRTRVRATTARPDRRRRTCPLREHRAEGRTMAAEGG